jgi:hypothetical protein
VIIRALYGLKSSGASWRLMFAKTLDDMNFKSSRVDQDVYLQRNQKANGEHYNEMILVYSYDTLVCSHDPMAIMNDLQKSYELKEGSVGPQTSI